MVSLAAVVYDILYFICKLSFPIFFSDVAVVGRSNVPPVGPCIIIGYAIPSSFRSHYYFSNHPNELLDVVSIGCTCGRRLGFWGNSYLLVRVFWFVLLAKAPLFRGFLGKVLRASGAVPVARRMDSKDGATVTPADTQLLLEVRTFTRTSAPRTNTMNDWPESSHHTPTA